MGSWLRDQGQSQAGSNTVGPQPTKVDAQPHGSAQSSLASVKPPGLLQSTGSVKQNVGNVKAAEQSVQGGEATSQGVSGVSGVSGASPILQQVKNEVEKAAGPGQPVGSAHVARPLQMAQSGAYGGFPRPTLSTPHTVGGAQVHPGIPAQVHG